MVYGFNDDKSKVEIIPKSDLGGIGEFIVIKGSEEISANNHTTLSLNNSAIDYKLFTQYALMSAMVFDYHASSRFTEFDRSGNRRIAVDYSSTYMTINIYNPYNAKKTFAYCIVLMKAEFY